MKDTKKPKIRFKEFNDSWEQRKLSEMVGMTYGGGTPSTTNDTFWYGDIPWIQSSNVVEGELFNIDIKKHISREGLNHSAAQLIPENSVAVVTHVGVGKLVFMRYSYATSQDFISLGDMKCEPRFLCYALYKRLQEDLHIVQGSAIKGITKEDLMSKVISVPQITEQTKIANTLQGLDHLITLHQRECEKLLCFKKSMLEKMFPKNGEKYPEIRFSGFTDSWEQRKLSDMAIFNPKAELPDVFEYVDLESVVGTEMLSHRTESKRTAPSRAQRLAQKGDLFYQTVRPYQKNNYLFENPEKHYVFSTGYAQMRPIVDGRFLLCLVQNDGFVKDVLDNCTGMSYPAINPNDLAEIEVYSPSDPQEQRQIGDFFKKIDSLITLHQREVEKLVKLKKSMLEKMFI